MGTGSFGGGSGSLGGGGSGSGGGGGGPGGAKKKKKGSRGSLESAVQALLDLSQRLRRDPRQATLTAEIYRALQDKARRNYIQGLFEHPFSTDVLRDLLEIGGRIRDGGNWRKITADFEVGDGPGALQRLTDAIIDRNYASNDYSVDERFLDRASEAIKFVLLGAVDGDHKVFVLGDGKAVEAALDRDHFHNTIGSYLAGLMVSVINSDSVQDLGTARAPVATAATSVANAMYDKFKLNYLDKGEAKKDEILSVIGGNLHAFVGA